jgi:hypothetical protein
MFAYARVCVCVCVYVRYWTNDKEESKERIEESEEGKRKRESYHKTLLYLEF